MKQMLTPLLLLLLSAPTCVMAQESQNTHFQENHHDDGLFIGGSVTYWNNTEAKTTTLQLMPEAGWRFNHTWAAGLMLGYEFGSERMDGDKLRTHIFKLSPFIRYYYMHKGPFNLYIDGGIGYNHIKPASEQTGNKRNGFELGIRPGVCVDLTKGFCLCMRMGFAGYRHRYFTAEEQEIGNDGFGLRFAPEELMIGLELEF